MNKIQAAEQLRRALQMFAASLSEEQALEVPMIFNTWGVGKSYSANEMVIYGANDVGDPQLYKVIQAHTSQSDWTPDKAPSLFMPLGLDESGHPIWAQPTGAHDAYNKGDIVNYNGVLYESLIDGNVYSPEAYPAGWSQYTE